MTLHNSVSFCSLLSDLILFNSVQFGLLGFDLIRVSFSPLLSVALHYVNVNEKKKRRQTTHEK